MLKKPKMLEKKLHKRAEDYAYEEIKEGMKRGIRKVLKLCILEKSVKKE